MSRIPLGIESDNPGSYNRALNNREKKLAEAIRENQNIEDDFQQAPVCSALDNTDGTAYTGLAGDETLGFSTGKASYEMHIEAVNGTPTVLGPYQTASGLALTTAAANNHTDIEVTNGNTAEARSAYVVGSFPGAKTIYFETDVDVVTVANLTGLWAGWRKVETYTAPASYSDYATLYKDGSDDIYTSHDLNADGTSVDTDTTLNWTDGDNFVLRVEVDNNGATRFYVGGTEYLSSAPFTFDSGDTIIPFVALDGETGSNVTTLASWECGIK